MHQSETLQTSKLSLANLLSELDVTLLYLPTMLYELVLGNDWLPKVCHQTIGVLLVMLHIQLHGASAASFCKRQ